MPYNHRTQHTAISTIHFSYAYTYQLQFIYLLFQKQIHMQGDITFLGGGNDIRINQISKD